MTDKPTLTAPADHLEVLAFRSMHEERTLQPRRASLFESEDSGLIEEQSEFVAGELLQPGSVAPSVGLPSPQQGRVHEVESRGIPNWISKPARIRQHAIESSEFSVVQEAADTSEPDPIPVPVLLAPAPQPHVLRPPKDISERFRHASSERLPADSRSQEIMSRRVPVPSSEAAQSAVEPAHAEPSVPRGFIDRPEPVRSPSQHVQTIARVGHRSTLSTPEAATSMTVEVRQHGVMTARTVPGMQNMSPLFPAPEVRGRNEQTVEITIGRVEIRAATPSAPSKPSRPQPHRSLKEYLSRNREGSR
jgi:hypothetical protein